MQYPWTTIGVSMVCQCISNWLPLDCHLGAPMDHKWNTNWLPRECQWNGNGVQIDHQWSITELPIDWQWIATKLPNFHILGLIIIICQLTIKYPSIPLIYRVGSKKTLFCDSCSTGGSGMIQRVIYQSRTLSNILFFIEHTFLKRHCVTGVFVVTSGLGAAAFTSQVSE